MRALAFTAALALGACAVPPQAITPRAANALKRSADAMCGAWGLADSDRRTPCTIYLKP